MSLVSRQVLITNRRGLHARASAKFVTLASGLGTELIALMESLAPEGTEEFIMFTGAGSKRNIRTYERAGYVVSEPEPAPHGGIATVTLRKKAR